MFRRTVIQVTQQENPIASLVVKTTRVELQHLAVEQVFEK
jgi:hypothetical protein